MESTAISAERFWDLYFRNLMLRMERREDRVAGETYANPDDASSPVWLVRDVEKVRVHVEMSALREYDDGADGRFARIAQVPADLGAAMQAVIDRTYPYRDAAPFGKARMAELMTPRARTFRAQGAPSVAALEQALSQMVSDHTPALDQPIACLAWFLGERRQRSSSRALLDVIRCSSLVLDAPRKVHFTAVDVTFSALWKIDDKTALGDVLEVMRRTDERGCRKIAPLFERLLSTTTLLSAPECGASYYEPGFWADMLQPHRSKTAADWDRHDVGALFWELRWLAAIRLPEADRASLEKLAGDEVGIVRKTAGERLRR